ncbi:MAG: LPS assembly protein LptD [Verrucomicrobia subdivision 3 bacterium]|nr:LPS assembly protein LptD [Limisphaerales bacterium]
MALLMTGGVCLSAEAALTNQWRFEGDVSIDQRAEIAKATNRFTVFYGEVKLVADSGMVNAKTGDAVAQGNVRIERGSQVWQGDRVEYNFKTGKMVSEGFRTGQNPFFLKGDVIVGEQKPGVYVGANALVTTDDYAEPGYSIRAKMITVVPGEYIEAQNATLHIGDVPVFYFPYFRRSLIAGANNWTLIPGYRSLDGPYLLTSYNWYWNERLGGALHLDGRVKRGVGVGPDLNWRLPKFGEGTAGYYYIHDQDPGEDSFGEKIRQDRQRAFLTHLSEPRSNLTARLAVRYQSDEFVIRDFFESEYRGNVQPLSFLEVNQLWSNFSLDLMAQPQVNPFFETVERLPDVKLTGFRQQIGASPLYYESESSAGYLRRDFANTDTNNSDFAAGRADTFHQMVLPLTLFGWLNVTPRAGGRFTHYMEAHGQGATTEEEDRAVFNTGAEVSLKASRLWRGVQSKFWHVDGLRHIIQPSVNYVFIPHPTRRPRELPQFDYESPSPRLLPIEFPDYNSIDSIDSQNVLRLGLRNKLQTKRDGAVDNMLHWALYTDWRLNPREGQGTFADAYSDFDMRPFKWLSVNSEIRYDIDEGALDIADHHVVITPNNVWSFSVGHRYVRDDAFIDPQFGSTTPPTDPELGIGNNLFTTTIYYRLSENWAARMSHHFEARDGTLEEQYYTIYRDLRSWTAALTFRVRDNRSGPTDFTIGLTASLKSFPRIGLGRDSAKPSLLLGY